MSTTLPMLRDFSDRFSPIVVKELRQGLRTRFFTSALILFHALIILLLVTGTLGVPVEAMNGIFWGITGLMLLGVLPLRGFAALHTEATDGTLDMLTLTSISSFRILYGKWAALYSQSLLVAGSILPYMVARYFFGGVEILREGVALLILALGSAVITAALLAFSSQTSILLRLFLALCISGGAVPLGFFTAFMVSASAADSMLREFLALSGWEQCGIIGGILALVVYCVYYFLALGSSRIAPPSENHSTQKRLVAFTFHGALTVIGLLLAILHADPDAAVWTFIPLMALTLIVGMDVMTEEMPRFPTALATRRGRVLPGRFFGRFLHPGWASGVWLSVILCVMPLSIIVAITFRHRSWDWNDGPGLFMLCVLCACFVPVIVRLNRTSMFINWWTVQLCTFVCGILLSMFCTVMGVREFGIFGIFSPLTALFGYGLMDYASRDTFLAAGSAVSFLWLFAAMLRAGSNFGTYTALEREARQMAPQKPHEVPHDTAA